ncbi:MAG: protein-L-isoaspartate(D-aspartate) O-methyltransferase [Thermoguttaceae bacterium]|nr:protein-L-isoaspartate(D-aspartate) O-methyltransferase [Thermoguttaceae bacterium]
MRWNPINKTNRYGKTQMNGSNKFRWLTSLTIGAVIVTSALTVSAQGPLREWRTMANTLVQKYVKGAGVENEQVLDAIRNTPRHEFVPNDQKSRAYYDMSLPIGNDQTISSPFIVAYMTECLEPKTSDKVLEIGTGSGYQAAVLSPIVKEVYTIEIVPALGKRAAQTLKKLKYDNVHVKIGDGYQGWPEHAPFDKIIVTCSPEKVPPKLVEQLAEGGRIVIPLGERYNQTFYLLKKVNGEMQFEALRPTLFVPMTGAAEKRREVQPDGLHPTLENGDFEKAVPEGNIPDVWYYQRQCTWMTGVEAPKGTHYLKMSNSIPNLNACIMQGFAVDGKKVKRLKFTYSVKGEELYMNPDTGELPRVQIVFYDERVSDIARVEGRFWKGTFDWRTERVYFDVPPKATSAIIQFGLYGSVGTLYLDNVELDYR